MRYLFFSLLVILLTGASPGKIVSAGPDPVIPVAKNIVLLIGDGMGLSQISAYIFHSRHSTSFEQFPVIGFQKSHSLNNLVTDSAASATAMASGIKTKNNTIGLDEDGEPVKTILEEAEEKGLATGMIVASSIVHATPGAFVAHQPSRNLYEQIAADLLKVEVDLLIGGGKQYFDRRKSDERDLVRELKEKNYLVYDYFNDEIQQVRADEDKNLVYFTADNQPLPASQGRDYMPIATEIALDYLKKRSDNGFFLMIEGSQIDWSGHANQGSPLLSEIEDFDKTVRKVLDYAKKDGETLVIVTADHETGGLALNPGSEVKKPNMVFTTNGHTAAMVPVFAFGPGAENFGGIYENTEIYHKMKKSLGL